MRFRIVHEIKGRMRIHVSQKRMSYEEADTLQYYLESQSFVLSAKVYERNQDVAVCYEGSRQQLIALLQRFQYEEVQVPDTVLAHSGRELNRDRHCFRNLSLQSRRLLYPASEERIFHELQMQLSKRMAWI